MIETSGHLPECPCTAVGVPSCICDDYEECGSQCRHNCICDRLRAHGAAEYQRGRSDAAAAVRALLFRKDGRLHSVGSSIDEGPGVELCCSCDSNFDAVCRLVAAIDALRTTRE